MNTQFSGTNPFGTGAVYKCALCGKQTRDIGLGEASLGYCARCYVDCTLENSMYDGHITEADYEIKMEKLAKAKTGAEIEEIYCNYSTPEVAEEPMAGPAIPEPKKVTPKKVTPKKATKQNTRLIHFKEIPTGKNVKMFTMRKRLVAKYQAEGTKVWTNEYDLNAVKSFLKANFIPKYFRALDFIVVKEVK